MRGIEECGGWTLEFLSFSLFQWFSFSGRGNKEMSSLLADQQVSLVYEPKCGGGRGVGLRGLSQCCARGVQINFGDLTPYLSFGSNTLQHQGAADEAIVQNVQNRPNWPVKTEDKRKDQSPFLRMVTLPWGLAPPPPGHSNTLIVSLGPPTHLYLQLSCTVVCSIVTRKHRLIQS